jgi:hypothetical protein
MSNRLSSPNGTGQHITLVFFSFGLVELLLHDSVVAGVEDILQSTNYSSGWISIMVNLPFIFGTTALWCLQRKVKDVHKLWFSFVAVVLGSFGVSFFLSASLRITAVGLIGVGIACMENSVMSLSAIFRDNAINGFCIGGGIGRLFAASGYAGITSTYFKKGCQSDRIYSGSLC